MYYLDKNELKKIRNIYNHTIGRWQLRKELIVNNKLV